MIKMTREEGLWLTIPIYFKIMKWLRCRWLRIVTSQAKSFQFILRGIKPVSILFIISISITRDNPRLCKTSLKMVKNLMKKSRIQQRCSKRNLQYGMPIRATACGQTRINWVVELERCPSIISKSRPFISTSTNVPKHQCPTKQRTQRFLFKALW